MSKEEAFLSWAKKQASKRNPPKPPAPKGRKPKVGNDDDTASLSGGDEKIPAAVWYIGYRSSKGEESERHVTVHGVSSKDGVQYISAWCHERGSPRSFRVDRIVEAHDIATGEVYIDSDKILPALTEFVRAINSDAVKNSHGALKDCASVLNILMYLSRCDGQSHPSEIEVALKYIGDKWFEYDLDEKVLINHLRRLYPTREDYLEAIESTYRFKDEKFRKRVRQYAALMIEADGIILPEEYSVAAVIDEVKAQKEEEKKLKMESAEEEFWESLEGNPYVFKFSATAE